MQRAGGRLYGTSKIGQHEYDGVVPFMHLYQLGAP
jgi:hypothetical protein